MCVGHPLHKCKLHGRTHSIFLSTNWTSCRPPSVNWLVGINGIAQLFEFLAQDRNILCSSPDHAPALLIN